MITYEKPPTFSRLRRPLGATLFCDGPKCIARKSYGPDLCRYARTLAAPEGWYMGRISEKIMTSGANFKYNHLDIDLCPSCVRRLKGFWQSDGNDHSDKK